MFANRVFFQISAPEKSRANNRTVVEARGMTWANPSRQPQDTRIRTGTPRETLHLRGQSLLPATVGARRECVLLRVRGVPLGPMHQKRALRLRTSRKGSTHGTVRGASESQPRTYLHHRRVMLRGTKIVDMLCTLITAIMLVPAERVMRVICFYFASIIIGSWAMPSADWRSFERLPTGDLMNLCSHPRKGAVVVLWKVGWLKSGFRSARERCRCSLPRRTRSTG